MIVSVLAGIVITNAVGGLDRSMSQSWPNVPFTQIALVSIFLVTAFRFFPGNLSHMFQLEAYSSTTPYVWAFDLTVVGVESLFFIPLSRLSLEAGIGFFYALALLLALDVAWILSMIPQWRRKSRPGVPMIWAVLNLLCILPIVLVVWFKPFDILSGLGLLLMTLMLWAVGLADVVTTAPKWFGKAAVHWEGSWRAQFRLL